MQNRVLLAAAAFGRSVRYARGPLAAHRNTQIDFSQFEYCENRRQSRTLERRPTGPSDQSSVGEFPWRRYRPAFERRSGSRDGRFWPWYPL